MHTCLNCLASKQEAPLVSLQYQGEAAFICAQCFPLLIHNPARLAGKLKDAEKLKPAEHEH